MEGFTEAKFGIRGDMSDLHIELGQKFPDLFPEAGKPIPWEEEFARLEGIKPIVFEGLPESASFEVSRTDYRPRHDYDFYELTATLGYRSEHAGPWFLKFGKNSPDPGIFRTIFIPPRLISEYEGQGTEITTTPNADQDFADIVAKYVGRLVV